MVKAYSFRGARFCKVPKSHSMSAEICFNSGVPNQEYMYPQGYICLSEGVHLRLAIDEKTIFAYFLFPNIYTNVSENYLKKSLYAYC